MQGIFRKENTDKALKYGIYRHLPTYEKIIRNLVSFFIKNWTFTKRLTCFMVLLSLYECLNFYWMGFFSGIGTFIQWLVFIGIICVLYFICIAIYQRYSNKQGEIYTQALIKYQQQRRNVNGK